MQSADGVEKREDQQGARQKGQRDADSRAQRRIIAQRQHHIDAGHNQGQTSGQSTLAQDASTQQHEQRAGDKRTRQRVK